MIDQIDTAIIDALRVDGRASNQQLSRDLGIAPTIIAQRIRRLERDDVMRTALVCDFSLTGSELLLVVGLNVQGRPARLVAAELAQKGYVFSASTMLGRYNVEALVGLSGISALRTFVEQDLAAIEGISEVHFDVAIDLVKYKFNTVPFTRNMVPAPMDSPLLDALDRSIIAQLSTDARKSNSQVAEGLGIAEGTVRSRIKRLREADLIRFTALTNIMKLGWRTSVFIRIKTEPSCVRAVADEIARIPEAGCVIVIAGSHNILVVGPFHDNNAPDAPINRIYAVRGVLSIETSSIAESLKYNSMVAKITPDGGAAVTLSPR